MPPYRNIFRNSSYFLGLTPSSLFLLKFRLLVCVSSFLKADIVLAEIIKYWLNISSDVKIPVDFQLTG